MGINTAAVQRLYVAYFNRPADPIGLAQWESKLSSTVAATQAQLTTLAASFSGSAEYAALYAGQSNAQIVNNLYLNLFGRAAEPAGLTSWAGKLTAGTETFASIALQLTFSAQGTDATAIANKVSAATTFTTAIDTTAEIVGYSGTAAAASARTWLAAVTDVTATLTTATSTVATAVIAAVAAGTTTTGATFTLTTGIDSATYSTGNDTIIGDFTATASVNAADQINGLGGTDTLQLFGATTALLASNMPLSVTNIEVLKFSGTPTIGAYDLTNWTKAVTGIATVAFDNASAVGASNITTTTGQALSLATGPGGVVSGGTTVWAGSAVDTSLNLTLNGYQGGTGVTPIGLTVTGAAATTLNITSSGAANKVGTAATTFFTGPVTVTSHVVSGDKALTYVLAAADAAALNSINASASTGGVSADVRAGTAKIGFAFTGGSGDDAIIFANDAFTTLTAGTQLVGGTGSNDKIGLLDTAVSAAEAVKINAATGFEVLGLNATITLDSATVSNYKKFSVDTAGLTQTISNLATGSTANITLATTSLTLGTGVGVSDITINIGIAGVAGITVGTLVTTGITSVALSSNGSSVSAITTLTNSDNSVFNVTGAAALTMTLSAGTAVGSKIDASALTGIATLVGSTIIASGDILIGGSAADFLTGGRGADTMTGGAGADTFIFVATQNQNTNGTAFGTNFDTITDFVVGSDKLQFTTVNDSVSAQQGAVQTAVTALTAGSTSTQIATAMALANTTNLGVSFAVFEGSTYVLYEEVGASLGDITDDVFIKLTGLTTAPTFAADVIA